MSKRSREPRRTAAFPDAEFAAPAAAPSPVAGERTAGFGEFVSAHPVALTLHCSDGRFTEAVERLMRQEGFARYDTVAMPGGPALLDMTGANILEAEATRAGVTFLVRGHGIRHAVLVAHVGCGFYRKRLAGQPPELILQRQVHDLQVAAAWFRRVHPGVDVRAFLALVEGSSSDGEGRIVFRRVELDARESSLLL
jgi:hypothetical protein